MHLRKYETDATDTPKTRRQERPAAPLTPFPHCPQGCDLSCSSPLPPPFNVRNRSRPHSAGTGAGRYLPQGRLWPPEKPSKRPRSSRPQQRWRSPRSRGSGEKTTTRAAISPHNPAKASEEGKAVARPRAHWACAPVSEPSGKSSALSTWQHGPGTETRTSRPSIPLATRRAERQAGQSRTSTPSMPHGAPLHQSRPSRARRCFPACSALLHLLANQRASCVRGEEAGGETTPAQRKLVRGVHGFVPKWRSAATASPSLRSGAWGGEGCRPGLSAGGPAGEGENGAQPTRSALPAPGREGGSGDFAESSRPRRVGGARPASAWGWRRLDLGRRGGRREGDWDQAPSPEGDTQLAAGSLRERNGCRGSRGEKRGLRWESRLPPDLCRWPRAREQSLLLSSVVAVSQSHCGADRRSVSSLVVPYSECLVKRFSKLRVPTHSL